MYINSSQEKHTCVTYGMIRPCVRHVYTMHLVHLLVSDIEHLEDAISTHKTYLKRLWLNLL